MWVLEIAMPTWVIVCVLLPKNHEIDPAVVARAFSGHVRRSWW